MRHGQRNGASWWDKTDLAAKDAGIEAAGHRRTLLGDAMSWLIACVIEGFAANAHALYPWHCEDDRARRRPDALRAARPPARFTGRAFGRYSFVWHCCW